MRNRKPLTVNVGNLRSYLGGNLNIKEWEEEARVLWWILILNSRCYIGQLPLMLRCRQCSEVFGVCQHHKLRDTSGGYEAKQIENWGIEVGSLSEGKRALASIDLVEITVEFPALKAKFTEGRERRLLHWIDRQ